MLSLLIQNSIRRPWKPCYIDYCINFNWLNLINDKLKLNIKSLSYAIRLQLKLNCFGHWWVKLGTNSNTWPNVCQNPSVRPDIIYKTKPGSAAEQMFEFM